MDKDAISEEGISQFYNERFDTPLLALDETQAPFAAPLSAPDFFGSGATIGGGCSWNFSFTLLGVGITDIFGGMCTIIDIVKLSLRLLFGGLVSISVWRLWATSVPMAR